MENLEFLRKMCIESALGTAFFLVHHFALNRFKLKQFSMENPESSSHVSICRLVQVQCWFDDKDLARTERTIVARKSFHHVTDRLVT